MVCSVGSCIDEIDTASTAEAIRKLNARKDVLVKDVSAINAIGQTMMKYSESLAGDSISPRQAERFFENLLSRSHAMTSSRADLEEEILQLSRQIDALSSAEKKKEGKTDGEVTVVIMTKQPTDIQLRLTYRKSSSISNVKFSRLRCPLSVVRSAIWSAAYELHATTEAGIPASSVSLHYRARITQSTGEDWTDVKLTLSTADMDLSNKTIPVLRPTKIQPPESLLFGSFGTSGRRKQQARVAPGVVQNAVGGWSIPGPTIPPGGYAVPQQGAFIPATAVGSGGQIQPQGAFGSIQAPVVYDCERPQAPIVIVGQPGDGPTDFGMASKQAIPMPPTQSQNTGFGAFAPPAVRFGQTAQAPYDVRQKQTAVVPVDEWQDIEEDDDAIADEEQMNAIGESTSVIHESPLALTYHVEGASGVPSDGVPHQVTIAVLPFEAKIQHVTVPKVRPVAYLQATVKNTSDYRLLPGTVHAFVDDSFVSKTSIVGDVAPGDVFRCTLGADPATRIRYTRTSKRADDSAGGADGRRERSAFSEQWAATMYRSRTTVTNRHPFALRELVVRDGVPLCEDEKRVSVVLRHPAGLAELEQGKELQVGEKEDSGREGDDDDDGEGKKKQKVRWCKVVDGKGGKREGLFEWVVEVGAGEELTIETEWDIKAPVSLNWIESM